MSLLSLPVFKHRVSLYLFKKIAKKHENLKFSPRTAVIFLEVNLTNPGYMELM